MRNFRLGEWLPEPLTPLFEDWMLPVLDAGGAAAMRDTAGAVVRFPYGTVNGWYYTAHPRPGAVLRAVATGRARLLRYLKTMLFVAGRRPEVAERRLLAALTARWRVGFLPRYRAAVTIGEARVADASRDELTALVDRIGTLAGEQLFWISAVGGAAWKMEGALGRFFRRHLAAHVHESAQVLLCGLPAGGPVGRAHAVQTLDWHRPTAGELGWAGDGTQIDGRRTALLARRDATEAACRAALAGRPDLLARFTTLLVLARRYAALREDQADVLTLGWPLLRRCVLRLGELLRAEGVIEDVEDVFFLTRAELTAGRPAAVAVAARRARWERWRRLAAPLHLGRREKLAEKFLNATVEAVRTTTRVPEGAIVGHPASPGRATGPARLVRGPEDFDRFRPGDVLLSQATAPAWTPLFGRAAAVVTDGGTLAAHASLIAREYGIPAVVGLGDATARIGDGQLVTVDGGAGTVEPHG
jgi:pyruvate,water dikinase